MPLNGVVTPDGFRPGVRPRVQPGKGALEVLRSHHRSNGLMEPEFLESWQIVKNDRGLLFRGNLPTPLRPSPEQAVRGEAAAPAACHGLWRGSGGRLRDGPEPAAVPRLVLKDHRG